MKHLDLAGWCPIYPRITVDLCAHPKLVEATKAYDTYKCPYCHSTYTHGHNATYAGLVPDHVIDTNS